MRTLLSLVSALTIAVMAASALAGTAKPPPHKAPPPKLKPTKQNTGLVYHPITYKYKAGGTTATDDWQSQQ